MASPDASRLCSLRARGPACVADGEPYPSERLSADPCARGSTFIAGKETCHGLYELQSFLREVPAASSQAGRMRVMRKTRHARSLREVGMPPLRRCLASPQAASLQLDGPSVRCPLHVQCAREPDGRASSLPVAGRQPSSQRLTGLARLEPCNLGPANPGPVNPVPRKGSAGIGAYRSCRGRVDSRF